MPTIRDVLSAYRADRAPVVVCLDRIDNIARHLSCLASLDVSELTRQRIGEYIERRVAQGVKPQTVRRELAGLRAALRLAWRDAIIDRVPPIALPPRGPRRERVLSAAEIRALLSAASARPRCLTFLRLLIATCGRLSAVCELTWPQVDLERKIIDLRSNDPKAARKKKRAVVPISPDLVTYLRAFRNHVDPSPRRGSRLNPGLRVVGAYTTTATGWLREAAKEAGVEGATPHVIRHSVATQMLREGVPLPHVSMMLGHASVAITADIYGHLRPDDLRSAAGVLDAWISPVQLDPASARWSPEARHGE